MRRIPRQLCFDCGTPHRLDRLEGTVRRGLYELVCIDCYVNSGDDNYASYLRHRMENKR